MYGEGMGREMLSPRERVERAEKAADATSAAENEALEKAKAPKSKKNRIAWALGLSTAMAMAMITGESRADTPPVAASASAESGGKTPETKVALEKAQEAKLRAQFDGLKPPALYERESGYTLLADASMAKHEHGGRTTVDRSHVGGKDYDSWTSKPLVVARSAGTLAETKTGNGTTRVDRESKSEVRVYEPPPDAKFTVVDLVRKVDGAGSTPEEAVMNALGEAAFSLEHENAFASSGTVASSQDAKKSTDRRVVTVSTKTNRAVIGAFVVTGIEAPKEEGGQYKVSLNVQGGMEIVKGGVFDEGGIGD